MTLSILQRECLISETVNFEFKLFKSTTNFLKCKNEADFPFFNCKDVSALTLIWKNECMGGGGGVNYF